MVGSDKIKSAFDTDFKKRFYTFEHLNYKNFQMLKKLKTLYKITNKQTLNQLKKIDLCIPYE